MHRLDASLKLTLFLAVFLVSLPFATMATQTRDKFWSLLTLNGDYHNLVYTVEPQLRLVTPGGLFQQFLANTGLGYKMNSNWQLWIGQTFSADSQDAVPGSLDEYRLWQQIVWRQSFTQFNLTSRTRLEERRSLNFSEWAFRLRQRLTFNRPLTEIFSLVIYDEAFVSLNPVYWIITNTFDQNRAYIGVEQQVTKGGYIGAGYMNQYLSTTPAQSDNVFVLNGRIEL